MTANSAPNDPRLDRLYRLLPAIYRIRDAEQKYPLKALLRVIAEQVNVVEDDIARLYDNWFIETAEDWVVPYLAQLIGYRPALDAGEGSGAGTPAGNRLQRVLVPRREVANTIRYRRRKGSLSLLELLAADVAGWPARAVEFYRLLGWSQNLNHQHPERARTVDLRQVVRLDRLGGPFDAQAYTVDVRRIDSHRAPGRSNIPSVGLFVWRLRSYPVTHQSAYCDENRGRQHCYTFSVLGQDAPLFAAPEPESDPYRIAGEANVPAPIRRLAFRDEKARFYGPDKSLAIWAEGWAGYDPERPIPESAIIPADLSGWAYLPPMKHVAVDPVLGRFAFPPTQTPKKGVRVTYRYGFSGDMGGGEYPRTLTDPAPREVEAPSPGDPLQPIRQAAKPVFYRVGKKQPFQRISEALARWRQDAPWDAVIELVDSAVYADPIAIELRPEQTLQLRAASQRRPVIRLLDWQTEMPDALAVSMAAGSRLTLDGLLITGRGLQISGSDPAESEGPRPDLCGSSLVIRHCTLVPGWGLAHDCEPRHPAKPSLELVHLRAPVRIERCILGSIEVHEDEVDVDPIPLRIEDSILDATDPRQVAIGAPDLGVAFATLTILRCTVFGIVEAHAVDLAESSIFTSCVNIARRQLGCMRFCHVPAGCRTPRRYHCQPDLVEQVVREAVTDPAARSAAMARERLRVRPQFTSSRYGNPGYAQLGPTCAAEIGRGAEDESEMGAFHDLYQPQREANLRARLEEYTPAGMGVGILFAT